MSIYLREVAAKSYAYHRQQSNKQKMTVEHVMIQNFTKIFEDIIVTYGMHESMGSLQ